MNQEQAPSDPDELVLRLRERLEERRRAGQYPEGLESSLEEHARRILSIPSRPPEDLKRGAREALERLERVRHEVPQPPPPTSRLPLGQQIHTASARLQSRQLNPVVTYVTSLAEATSQALKALLDVVEEPEAHAHGDVLEQLDALFNRLSSLDRRDQPSSHLEDRVQRLEEAERRRSFEPFYSSVAFEDRFRGAQTALTSFYTPLADELVAQAPVLEIGCGQGSLLKLLRAREVPASGVELDRQLAKGCRAQGLDVVVDDGIEVLARAADGSLGAIVALQVIEHLTPQRLSELVVIAREKLRPGGWLVMETPNPQSLFVFAHAFYIDPTHQVPVHPAYLEFLVREAGFSGVRIEWLSPVNEDEAVLDDGTENSRRTAALLSAPQDYRLYAVP